MRSLPPFFSHPSLNYQHSIDDKPLLPPRPLWLPLPTHTLCLRSLSVCLCGWRLCVCVCVDVSMRAFLARQSCLSFAVGHVSWSLRSKMDELVFHFFSSVTSSIHPTDHNHFFSFFVLNYSTLRGWNEFLVTQSCKSKRGREMFNWNVWKNENEDCNKPKWIQIV